MANTQTPFQQAAAFFPEKLRKGLLAIEEERQRNAEEIRLRAGKELSILDEEGKEDTLPEIGVVSQQELQGVIEIATTASFHRAMDKLCRGYFPLAGGHRLGVAGSAVMREGHIHHFRALSSLALRIAHEVPGAALPVAQQLTAKGLQGSSCLILAPPGYGKTTLLRDLIRIYSDHWKLRVGIADERGEIAAPLDGVPQFEVGNTVDVMDGCGKGEAGLLLLRSMNPQVIAMDRDCPLRNGGAGDGPRLRSCGTFTAAPLSSVAAAANFSDYHPHPTCKRKAKLCSGGSAVLHLIGGLCVITGSAVIGLQLIAQRRKRLEEGNQLLSACRLMERELRCREPDLSQLLEAAEEQSDSRVRDFFNGCRRHLVELGSRSFDAIWRDNLIRAELSLPRREQELLAGLGSVLGRYDRTVQCTALGQVAAELEEQLRKEGSQAQKRNKLYMTLSIAGGMLLVVLTC